MLYLPAIGRGDESLFRDITRGTSLLMIDGFRALPHYETTATAFVRLAAYTGHCRCAKLANILKACADYRWLATAGLTMRIAILSAEPGSRCSKCGIGRAGRFVDATSRRGAKKRRRQAGGVAQ